MSSQRVVKRASDFVERTATSAVVSFPEDGSVFVIDFLKPNIDIVVDERGKIVNVRGELEITARIVLPPMVCKRLLNALKNSIEKYESAFGEIRVKRPGGEKSRS